MDALAPLTALAAALAGLQILPGDVSPALVGIIVVLLLIVFGLFLFVRRILLSFTEGLRRGRGGNE
ncbi:hypothetical protein HWV23_07590 [Natronomonas halophila]|uniref:DUF7859 family protein n=1 Tax=Natronomonas halophila TaxID=2747817 RepID=UPI0015B67151|nr:hypothetical protein [Natronomonas halophila]QLD84144.1 hypothetical protein HWV23_07590 [Natronomonas halophila]